MNLTIECSVLYSKSCRCRNWQYSRVGGKNFQTNSCSWYEIIDAKYKFYSIGRTLNVYGLSFQDMENHVCLIFSNINSLLSCLTLGTLFQLRFKKRTFFFPQKSGWIANLYKISFLFQILLLKISRIIQHRKSTI